MTMFIHFLFVSSRSHYQAEPQYIENGVFNHGLAVIGFQTTRASIFAHFLTFLSFQTAHSRKHI